MKLLYAMSHPSDRLDDERAGHVVRPRQLLARLRAAGHEVLVCSAAERAGTQQAASLYRSARAAVPSTPMLLARDALRVVQNEAFARRLTAVARQWRPHAVLETQVAFSRAGERAAHASGALLALDDVSPVTEDEEVYDVCLRKVARQRRSRSLAAAGLVVVTSSTIAEAVQQEGVDARRVLVLPNGFVSVDARGLPSREAARERLGLRPTDVVAAYAGSFQRFHRVDVLIEALALDAVPREVRVLLIGDGDERSAVEAQVARLGLSDRVVLTGRVPSDDVPSHLRAADVTVLPGTADYTNPMKLYDYLAAGRPIIAPEQRSVWEVVSGQDAVLFTPGSPDALAAALCELATDPDRRHVLGEAGLRLAAGHTWDARATALAEVLAARVGHVTTDAP